LSFFDGKKGAAASAFAETTYVPFSDGQISGTLVTKLNTQIVHLSRNRTSDTTKKIDDVARRELFRWPPQAGISCPLAFNAQHSGFAAYDDYVYVTIGKDCLRKSQSAVGRLQFFVNQRILYSDEYICHFRG
jgi:hypothetical protein